MSLLDHPMQHHTSILLPSLIDLACFPRPKANEPYELWKGIDRRGDEYKRLKEERAKALWQVSRGFRGIKEYCVVMTSICQKYAPPGSPAGPCFGASHYVLVRTG